MFERFTKPAREVVVTAQEEAQALGGAQIGSQHVLLGILADARTTASKVLHDLGVDYRAARAEVESLGDSDAAALKAIGIDLDEVRRSAERVFGPGALRRVPERAGRLGRLGRRRSGRHIPFDRAAKKSLELALREAISLGHNYIGAEHILLGLMRDEKAESMQVLRRLGVSEDFAALRTRIKAELDQAA